MEVDNELKFVVPNTAFYFSTQVNGDKLVLSNLTLSQEQATTLAWLINHAPDTQLEIQIKLVGD